MTSKFIKNNLYGLYKLVRNLFFFFFLCHNCFHIGVIRFIGLSSSGITYKSGSASYSSGNYQSSDRYGGTRDGGRYGDGYRDRDQYEEEKYEKDTYGKSRNTSESQGSTLKKGSTQNGR